MVFQEARLFPWLTVEKNIAFGIHEKLPAEEKKKLVAEHIKMVGLENFEKALPGQLSGGMRAAGQYRKSTDQSFGGTFAG